MESQQKKTILTLQGYYLIAFFGVGGLLPLLSVYLNEVAGFSGVQIGTIMSIGPVVMIFFQPIWGILCDTTNAPTKVLSITTFFTGLAGLGFLLFDDYTWIVLTAVILAIFQSGINPISDSITIKYTSKRNLNYGSIRLYGSLGFGLAVFIMGRLSESAFGPSIIFYSFFISLSIAAFIATQAPVERARTQFNLQSDFKNLITIPRFYLFLVIAFLIFGPNLANNTYFGLFVKDSGGTFTGIGVAFLIAVLSEIPFMQVARKWILRIGILQIMALAGLVSLLRWILYFWEPSLWIIYISSVTQGVAVGLFIPAALQYIKDITPTRMTATAITLYAAIANGLGNWFSTFVGGMIYDEFSIFAVYCFFSILTTLGIVLNVKLIKLERTRALQNNVKLVN